MAGGKRCRDPEQMMTPGSIVCQCGVWREQAAGMDTSTQQQRAREAERQKKEEEGRKKQLDREQLHRNTTV